MNTSNKTLLQILVEELPKLESVPTYWSYVFQDYDKELRFNGGTSGIRPEQLASNHRRCGMYSDHPEYYLIKVTRDQYEAALEASKEPLTGTGVDGWIDWPGGECPVPVGTLVDVKMEDTEEARNIGHTYFEVHGQPAGEYGTDPDWSLEHWGADVKPSRIIAYRLHKPQEAEQSEADD